MQKTDFFSKEIKPGVFLISSHEWEESTSTVNCWLIVGKEKAMLVDAGLPCLGLRQYVEQIAGKPIVLVLTHGHFDHAGGLESFEEFWINPEEEKYLCGEEGLPETRYSAKRHSLFPGECVDLGNRMIQVYGIQGHTKGSIVLLDPVSKILFSGDSVARRGLFLDTKELPMSKYFSDLLCIEKLDFEGIASAHDRFLLPKTEIKYFISAVISNINKEGKIWKMPTGKEFFSIHAGTTVEDPYYISCSVPYKQLEITRQDIFEWCERNPWFKEETYAL